ncbi:hypothetical protein HHX48_14125 [Salinimonas sp. HHU 13199]|uniref:Phytase-like domain-containing protein n=1 Tax=Salinimonas profundi TaxID=2729140 RepID=A0ABR8LS11_9ALTE|nr:hypothetical protein [Salinimonas profundi]MBD3586879.1 hypothetical protein [Salinimonas profundi]
MLAFILVTCCAAGCAASSDYPLMKLDIVDSRVLPNVIKESSGLFCTPEGAVTINDSGNDTILYFLNETGRIDRNVRLDFPNKDIEALTANADFFYVADIGNNRGNRNYVSVREVDRHAYKKTKTLRLTYAGNTPSANTPYNHDYDGEALTAKDDKLVLFSKSWDSGDARVYEIAPAPKSQKLTAIATIKGLPGIITGADWDTLNQRFLVVGYNSNLLGVLRPFIAIVDSDYQVVSVSPLERFGQVEGVCARADGEVWLTQEKSPLQDARLIRLKIK